VLRGAGHYGFVDLPPLPLHIAHLVNVVPMSGNRQIEITRDYLHTFFDVYLKGEPASKLQSLRYPEVRYSR
jgi:hypothetical protein